MKEEVNNIFRKSYEQHQSNVDPVDIWKEIEAKRQQKKRPQYSAFLFGSIMLIGVIALGYYLSIGEVAQSDSTLVNVTDTKEVTQQKEETSNNNRNKIAKTPDIKKGLAIVQETSTQKKNRVSQTQTQDLVKSNAKLSNRTNQSGQQILAEQRKYEPSMPNGVNEISQKVTTLIVLQSQADSDVQTKSNEVVFGSLFGQSNDDGQTRLNEFPLLSHRQSIFPINLSGYEPSMSVDSSLSNKRIGKFTNDLFSGVGLFSQKYSSGNLDYDKLRAETEQPLESMYVGLLVGYQLHNFGFKTGLMYSRFNTKVLHLNQYFGLEDNEQISPYSPDSFNPQLLSLSNSEPIILYSQMQLRYNSTQTYSIPLLFSYNFRLGKIFIEPSLGFNFHVHQVVKQSILTPDSKLELLDSNSIKIKNDRIGTLSIFYPMSNHLHFGIELIGIQRHSKDLYSERSTLGCNLGFGVRYLGF